jgi:PTH1 family peptidyl-tRNA hydrolase
VALVLGLGNPGPRYASTRHNVGWWVVDRLVQRWRGLSQPGSELWSAWRIEHPRPGSDAARRGSEVVVLKPLTFMNASGEALRDWVSRQGVPPVSLLVVTDDVYLPVGALRLRASGSSGGHRGLQSIEQALGSREYARLRIGVGAAEAPELRDHVLDTPEGEEREALERAADVAADAVESWLGEGILATMNRFNRRVRKEVSEP